MSNTTINSSQSKSSPALSIDPGILEMGASVSVNDEMRRSLATETADIDTACTKLLSELKTEESSTAELRKSKTHADAELSGMLQCSKELIETVQMNEQVFRDLQSKVDADIAQIPSLDEQSKRNSDGTKLSPTSVLSIQQSFSNNKAEVTGICQDIHHAKAVIHNLEDQRNHVLEEHAILHDKIKSEHLQVTLANHKNKTRIMEDLLKKKHISRHTDKVAGDIAMSRIEKLRETLRAKEGELEVQKQAFVESEQKMKQAAMTIDKEKKASSKILDDLKHEGDNLEEKIKQLSHPLDEARNLIQQREQAKAQLEKVRGERATLYAKKMDQQAQISAAQKKLENIERDKIKEENAANTIAQLRISNEAFERDVMLANLAEKEQQLVDLDEFFATTTFPEKEHLSEAIVEKKQELAQLKQSINAVISEKKQKESTLSEYRRVINDHQDGYQKDFDKIKALLVEEYDTAAALEKQIKQHKKSDESEHGYILRKAKLYKYAAEFLKTIEEKKAKIAMMEGKEP